MNNNRNTIIKNTIPYSTRPWNGSDKTQMDFIFSERPKTSVICLINVTPDPEWRVVAENGKPILFASFDEANEHAKQNYSSKFVCQIGAWDYADEVSS